MQDLIKSTPNVACTAVPCVLDNILACNRLGQINKPKVKLDLISENIKIRSV